jgi:hypothetical protein
MRLKALSRLARLSLPDALQTGAACLVAAFVEVGLRTTSLPRLAAILGVPLVLEASEPSGSAAEREADAEFVLPPEARRRLAATRRVLRHWPFGDTCLRQALISGQRLRWLEPRLQVGVAKFQGEVRAHAWLLIRCRILDPSGAAASYLPLNSIPSGLGG